MAGRVYLTIYLSRSDRSGTSKYSTCVSEMKLASRLDIQYDALELVQAAQISKLLSAYGDEAAKQEGLHP